MTSIVFLRDGMILISSLIVRLLLIVFSLVRCMVRRFPKIMLIVCALSILFVNTGQDGMTFYRLKTAVAGMIFALKRRNEYRQLAETAECQQPLHGDHSL